MDAKEQWEETVRQMREDAEFQDESVLYAQGEIDRLRAENERLKESFELMRDCIVAAVNAFEGIRWESQFCDSCQAFARSNAWLYEWHGGERAVPPNASHQGPADAGPAA